MSIFDQLSQKKQPAGVNQQPEQALQSLRSDPVSFLSRAGYTVPDGMNDAQQIVNHLLQSGQVSNQRLQAAQRMMGMMGRR